VVSDAHLGLRAAISKVFIGASWQRCRVHFMRNLLARVHKAQSPMVAALVRTIFAQADKDAVAAQLDEVASRLEQQFPDVAAMLVDTREDVCAFAAFPRAHWTKIWSTNSIERLSAARESSGSSPTMPARCASSRRSASRPTRSGWSPRSATCPRAPWRF
jgi:putative transposase